MTNTCPCCKSTRTLGDLRVRRYQLMERKGLATPRATAIPSIPGNLVVGIEAKVATATMCGTAIGWQAGAESFGLAIGHEARAPLGRLALGPSVVETCQDCGTMYAPNHEAEARRLKAQLDELESMPDTQLQSTDTRLKL